VSNLPTARVGDRELNAIQMLQSRASRLDEILPQTAGLNGAQLIRIAQFELMRNSDLAECNPHSVMQAVYDSARLGLLLGREAHLVPFKRRCSLIVDNRGYITLTMRSGAVTMIDADVVFPQDKFSVKKGTAMELVHEPDYEIDRGNTEEITHAYAVSWLHGAPRPLFHVMNRQEIERIRAVSKMKDQAPWREWWDRMAMKTCIRFLVDKRLPLTKIRELNDAIELDRRLDTGKVTQPLHGETDDELGQVIDQETEVRKDELKMALAEERKAQEAEEKAKKSKK
jgi:recombination protein RecT